MNAVHPPRYSSFAAGSSDGLYENNDGVAALFSKLRRDRQAKLAGRPKWTNGTPSLLQQTERQVRLVRALADWTCDDAVALARRCPDGLGSLGTEAEGVIRRVWKQLDDAAPKAEADAAEAQSVTSALPIVFPTSLFGKPVPERKWIVRDWLPVGYTTLNYADGGSGKTLVAQQLMTSCATGGHWLGMDVERCRSIALFCEDDEDELHRRQAAICDSYGIQMRDLGDMCWISGVGEDNTLVTYDLDGNAEPTERFLELERAAKALDVRLVIIDTAADTFGGNENDRRQVRQFIGKICGKLARDINGAVLVNAHPSRQGMQTGDLDGGSTAWSNSARSRWSMARPKGDDVPADTDQRILTRRKANYSAIGEEVRLRWEKGVFVPTGAAGTTVGGPVREALVDAVFLDLLDRCTASNIPLSHSKNAVNFAPKVFANRPDRQGVKKAEFETAMTRMLADHRVVLEGYGRKGDPRQRLARGTGSAT